MSLSSNFASSPSNNEKRTITPGSQLSSSSIIQRRKDDATIKTLKRQLRDAQNVVKVVLGVDEVDKKACIKAAQQVSSMQSEMTKLRDDYKAARDEQEELERRMEMINGESTNGNKGRNMGANGFDKNEYFSQSYEEHLESKLAATQELLDEREAELKILREQLATRSEAIDQSQNKKEIEQLRIDLIEARSEVEELERERELNMGEIASLTKQLRNLPGQQAKNANADYQDLEEARARIEKLERERLARLSKEKELLRQLKETKSELGKYADNDSNLDYVQRVAFLEKDLAEKQSIATELASKEAEIKQLRFEIDELSKHSSRWEIAASESSAQVLKMANQIEETQHSVAALERQLKDKQFELGKYKDCDSNLDYVNRVAVLERELSAKETKVLLDRALKDEEIRKLRLEIDELSKHSSSWENAASESSAQVLKMATHIEETRNCVANLEIQLKETKSKLAKYKDCDSNLDYVQRVADLERELSAKEAKAIYDLAVKEEEIRQIRFESQEQCRLSTRWETAANELSTQVLKMERNIEEMQKYVTELEIENRDLIDQMEGAETLIAELEDKHWLRDQKLAGLTTMYHESAQKLKMLENENDAMRSSFSNIDDSLQPFNFAMAATESKPLARNDEVDDELKKKNKELRRKVQRLSNDLEKSAINLGRMAKELDDARTSAENFRAMSLKGEQEKKKLENDLLEMEERISATEKKRVNDASLALGLGAKEIATNTRILKLQQEKRTLERKLKELSEKQEPNQQSVADKWEPFESQMKLQESQSIILKLQTELVAAKREIHELCQALKSERAARASDVNKLTKSLEESQAQVAIIEKRNIGSKPLGNSGNDNRQSESNAYTEPLVHDLQSQLVAKDEDIRRWEEQYTMQVDQVNGLRQQLTETLSKLEDLEYERNFNDAKLMELRLVNTVMMQSDDDELHRILADKAIQCAELETKFARAQKDSAIKTNIIEKLEMECAMNKAKVAELSAIWDSQALDEKARKAVILKAMEVAEQLNDALQRIEQLEIENERSTEKASSLAVKLANSVKMVDDLAEKLTSALSEKAELEKTLKAGGIPVGDVENKSTNLKRLFAFAGSNPVKPEGSERLQPVDDIAKPTTTRREPPASLLSGQL